MSEKVGRTIADPELAEKVFLAGAVLAATVLCVYAAYSAQPSWFELRAALSGVVFGALNFRSWKLLVRLMLGADRGADDAESTASRAKDLVFALTIKGVVVLLLILFLVLGNSAQILSLILGFALYLMCGVALLILVYIVVGGWRTVSGADHELLLSIEEEDSGSEVSRPQKPLDADV